jgi:hypothetical protein
VAYNVWDVGSTSEVAATQKKSLECGPGADDGGLTTSPGVILAGVLPMPVTSVTRVREGTTQSAEAAETVAPSQTGWNMPAAREEMLFTSRMSAGASEVVAKQGGAGGFRAESRVTAVTWTAALRTGGSSC